MQIMRSIPAFLLTCLLLAGCAASSKEQELIPPVETSGAKSGVFAALRTMATSGADNVRPSVALGVYVTLYLAQGKLIKVQSASLGIQTAGIIAEADKSFVSDETFVLLQEYGSVLQVNIIDILNRSVDRAQVLDAYTTSLAALNERVAQKMTELNQRIDDFNTKRNEQRDDAWKLEREMEDAMKTQDYVAVGVKQEAFTKAKTAVAETELRINEVKRILYTYEDLSKIGVKRLNAMILNRQILIAGLKVIDIPGIEGLGILEKRKD
ncbi:MAG: hypothetical protein V1926_03760 [Candidatus Peregrinibacteria bacterium]